VPKTKGRAIGSKCAACNAGILVPQLRSVSAGESRSGVMGLPLTRLVISDLACNNTACQLLYKAADAGLTIEDVRERQLADFKNPPERPTACPKCGNADLCRQSTHYLFCGSCDNTGIGWIVWNEAAANLARTKAEIGKAIGSVAPVKPKAGTHGKR
jgi:ribosomal protein L37AE/L43A